MAYPASVPTAPDRAELHRPLVQVWFVPLTSFDYFGAGLHRSSVCAKYRQEDNHDIR